MSAPAVSTRKTRAARARLTLTAAAISATTAGAMIVGGPWTATAAPGPIGGGFTETDLVSDVPHMGQLTDASVKIHGESRSDP